MSALSTAATALLPRRSLRSFLVYHILSVPAVVSYLPIIRIQRHTFALFSRSSSSNNNNNINGKEACVSVPTTFSRPSQPPWAYGGDFAGYSATFSPQSGKLIRVPEHLVPPSMIEWGQVPSCLEVIVSEDLDAGRLTRHTVTVVPEVGCGVDNLDTMKSIEAIELSEAAQCHHVSSDDTDDERAPPSVVVLDYEPSRRHCADDLPLVRRLETMFLGLGNKNQVRMRVLMDIILSANDGIQIQSPLKQILERKTSETSSHGTISDGGGLDARTVAKLLGDELRRKPFADVEPETAILSESVENMTTLNLPGNVTVSYGSSFSADCFQLQVQHSDSRGYRRSAKRLFDRTGTLDASVELSRNHESTST